LAANAITIYRGDFRGAALARYRWAKSGPHRAYRSTSYFILDCGSGVTANPWRSNLPIGRTRFCGESTPSTSMAVQSGGSALGDDFRKNFETVIPTVIAHRNWDLSTPFENALELAPYFRHGKLIPVVRDPHTALAAAMEASEEFHKGILHFAATGDMSQLPDDVSLPPVKSRMPASKFPRRLQEAA
jgi:hypothetical protein